jgi:hypothetical protein
MIIPASPIVWSSLAGSIVVDPDVVFVCYRRVWFDGSAVWVVSIQTTSKSEQGAIAQFKLTLK